MSVNLEFYRIFQAVAKTGSFSAAAKELFITQPAVSQGIKQMEEALHTTLFVRNAKGVSLTNEGKILFEYSESALNLIRSGEKKLDLLNNLLEGDLRIGAGDTITKHYIMPFLAKFHRNFPKIKCQVTNRTTEETIELLKTGKVDLAIANLPVEDKNVEFLECLAVEDIFVASEKYFNLKGRGLTSFELCEYPLVMLEKASNSRKNVDKFYESKGIELKPEIELGAHDLLLDFAKAGFGLSCVIKQFAGKELRSGELFEVKLYEPIPKRAVAICYLKSISLSAAAKEFIGMLTAK